MPRWVSGDATLTITDDLVLAEVPEAPGRIASHAVPADAFSDSPWPGDLVPFLGAGIVAEGLAWLKERNIPLPARLAGTKPARLGDRPKLHRGDPRTDRWTIHGRTVIVMVASAPFTAPIEVVTRGHLPPEVQLPEDIERRLVQAATSLAPLPCMCDTGVRTAEEHGSVRTVVSITRGAESASVARCTVCGRSWTFAEGPDGPTCTRVATETW